MTTSTTTSRRSAATQAAVDRYAADPAAKNRRSVELAQTHGLLGAARVTRIERATADECLYDAPDCLVAVTLSVPSASDARRPHRVAYDVATDTAVCDCPAGANGLPCGHAGAALTAGRALVRGDALLNARRAAIAREAAAWHAALDAMQAHEASRRATAHACEEAALLYRNPRRLFSMWRAE
jgi:hypothetical protein